MIDSGLLSRAMDALDCGRAAHNARAKADVLAEHRRVRDFLPKMARHADDYKQASAALHEAVTALAGDFAEVVEDPALQDVAARLSRAGREFAGAQASTLQQLLLLPFLREFQGPADLEREAGSPGDAWDGGAAERLAAASAEARWAAWASFSSLLSGQLRDLRAATSALAELEAATAAARPADPHLSAVAREPRAGAAVKAAAKPSDDRKDAPEGFDLIGLSKEEVPRTRSQCRREGPLSTAPLADSFLPPPKPAPPAMPGFDDLLGMTGASDDGICKKGFSCSFAGGGCSAEAAPADDAKQAEPESADASRQAEEDPEAIELRVQQWRQGKGIRALLASLHEVVPAGSRWEPMALGDLLEPSAVKDAWKCAALAVHPDKISQKVLGQFVFDALRAAMEEFRRDG